MSKYYKLTGLKSVMKVTEEDTVVVSYENKSINRFYQKIQVANWQLVKCSQYISEITQEEYESIIQEIGLEEELENLC